MGDSVADQPVGLLCPGEWLIHGHTHQPGKVDGARSVHAGLDAWGLRPAGDGEIAALIREAATA